MRDSFFNINHQQPTARLTASIALYGTAHPLKAGGPFFVAKCEEDKKMNAYDSIMQSLKEAIEYAEGNSSDAKATQMTSEQESDAQKDSNEEQQ